MGAQRYHSGPFERAPDQSFDAVSASEQGQPLSIRAPQTRGEQRQIGIAHARAATIDQKGEHWLHAAVLSGGSLERNNRVQAPAQAGG
jgi:hypothetical protein